MDLLNFGRIIRRSVGFLIMTTFVGALAGVGLGLLDNSGSDAQSPTYYSATETLGYDTSTTGPSSSGGASALATVGAFVTGPSVTDELSKQFGIDGAALARQITTVALPTTNSVDVTAFADSAKRAEQLATQFSAATKTLYAEELASRSEDQATQLGKRLDDLKSRREAVEAQLANPSISAVDRDVLNAESDALVNQYRIAYDRFINLASPDTSAPPLFTLGRPNAIPVDAATYQAALERGRTGQNHIVAGDAASVELTAESSSSGLPSGPVSLGLLGAVIGLAVGIGIATLRARFDNKLRARPDFEEAFALPILGGVPILARDEQARHMLSVIEKPYSPGAEVFRSVRSALLLLGTDNPDREGALVVMVASAQPKEGKSATCANLAAAFAESGRSVLAINCDYRRATLHHYFGLSNDGGRILATDVHGLSVVTNVPNTKVSPGRVAAQQRTFIEAQRANYDVILLDTAPLLSTSDPIDIVPTADFVLLVGRPGYTERDHARQTMELLDRHRVTVAGLLMTAVDPVGSDYYYYYSAYSSYASVTFPAEAERTDSADAAEPREAVSPTPSPDATGRRGKHQARLRWRVQESPSDDR